MFSTDAGHQMSPRNGERISSRKDKNKLTIVENLVPQG